MSLVSGVPPCTSGLDFKNIVLPGIDMKKIMISVILALFTILLPVVIPSILGEAPYTADAVFNDIKVGNLWSGNAKFVDDWYAVEKVDENTYIIGEPRSSQYNSSFLIIGNDKAIVLDAGANEHPENIQSMKKMAESLTDKPVTLILSHFHYDHIGDLNAFDGVLMLDLPFIRSRAESIVVNGRRHTVYHASVFETVAEARSINILGWVKPGEYIDLGGRKIQVLSTPGHAEESLTLVDHDNKYAFTGDFLYQHLGGLVAFLPGSNLTVYVEAINEFIARTGSEYRFFGSHGLQLFDMGWLNEVRKEMIKVRDKTVDLKMSETFLAPGLPLRLHQKGQILIYLPPYFDSEFLFSSRFLMTLGIVFITLTALCQFLKRLCGFS